MIRRLVLCGRWLLLATLACATLTLPSLAVDKRTDVAHKGPFWPQWRGPHRDDISPDTGLLDKWPETGPALAWKHSGLGAGFSSVTVADGRILTMGDRDGGQFVIALGLDGDKELWSARVGDVWDPNGYSGPRCSPSIDGARVYAIGTHGDLVCLETKNGHEVWRRSFPKDFQGKMHSGWGFSESPLVDGDRLICTPGGPEAGIVALDKKTGADVWRCAIPPLGNNGGDGAAYSSIVIGHGTGVKQYVQLIGRGVVGVAADNGKFLWGYNRVANGTANIPTPLVRDDYVFCSTGYGAGAALLKLNNSADGIKVEEVYFKEGKDLQNHHGGMVMVGEYVYMGHGHNAGAPTCVEWKTGKIVWRHNRGPGSGTSHVTFADNHLYFRFENGLVALVAASPGEYEEKGTFRIPDVQKPSWPHPVVIGGKLYLREQDTLYCYDVKK